jgi:hypothetical protein
LKSPVSMSIVSPEGATMSVLTDWSTLMKWISSVPDGAPDASVGVFVAAWDGVSIAVAVAVGGPPVSPPVPLQPASTIIKTRMAVRRVDIASVYEAAHKNWRVSPLFGELGDCSGTLTYGGEQMEV